MIESNIFFITESPNCYIYVYCMSSCGKLTVGRIRTDERVGFDVKRFNC